MHIYNRIGASGLKANESEQNIFEDEICDLEDDTIEAGDIGFLSCNSSFSGQITSIYVLEEVLSSSQLSALFELGPWHASQFKLEDAISYPDVGPILFDGSLYSKYYYPF